MQQEREARYRRASWQRYAEVAEIAELLDESEERIREIIDMCAADEAQEGK